MPEDMSDRPPEDMPDRMPEDLPDRMPEDMPEDMPDHMPEDMPDRMPNRMSEDMSDRMPEDLPVRKCINVMVGITRSKVILFFHILGTRIPTVLKMSRESGDSMTHLALSCSNGGSGPGPQVWDCIDSTVGNRGNTRRTDMCGFV